MTSFYTSNATESVQVSPSSRFQVIIAHLVIRSPLKDTINRQRENAVSGEVSAILGSRVTGREEISVSKPSLRCLCDRVSHMGSRENWVDFTPVFKKHRHLDAIFPKEDTKPTANPELSTLLHHNAKFIFLLFVLRLFCLEVWVRIWVVDFNEKNVEEASNDSTNQRAHYRNPPEVISCSEIKKRN